MAKGHLLEARDALHHGLGEEICTSHLNSFRNNELKSILSDNEISAQSSSFLNFLTVLKSQLILKSIVQFFSLNIVFLFSN